jgi:hypothetical protein
VLKLNADQPVFYAFNEGQLHLLTTVPELAGDRVIAWQEVEVPDGSVDEGGLEAGPRRLLTDLHPVLRASA